MRRLALGVLTLAVTLLASCAGPGDEDGQQVAGGGTGTGPITLAIGREGSGYLQPLLDRWNKEHPAERVTLLELPEASDEQRAQMVANLQAKSDRYDVLVLDVIWTAEFADAGWIIPLERSMFPLDRFLAPVVDTAVYKGKLWAVPYTSNAGLLYYRKDILDRERLRPPKTWAELREQAGTLSRRYDIGGYAGQLLAYEGLTVNFAEAMQSAGGDEIVSPDGTQVTMDVDKARLGLDFLRQGVREGWIPRAALNYKEEESRIAFQEGDLLFARNWPHAYGPAKEALGDRFGVTRLPGIDGPGSSSLGGNNLAISTYSKKQRSALGFIRYFTSLSNQRRVLIDGSFPPVWAELYDDPGLIKRFPYLPVLKETILNAEPRPVNADYNQMSLTIASAVSRALTPPFEESSGDIAASMKTELTEIIRAR
jgi:multiple sugar transport system substrate-binding protein